MKWREVDRDEVATARFESEARKNPAATARISHRMAVAVDAEQELARFAINLGEKHGVQVHLQEGYDDDFVVKEVHAYGRLDSLVAFTKDLEATE